MTRFTKTGGVLFFAWTMFGWSNGSYAASAPIPLPESSKVQGKVYGRYCSLKCKYVVEAVNCSTTNRDIEGYYNNATRHTAWFPAHKFATDPRPPVVSFTADSPDLNAPPAPPMPVVVFDPYAAPISTAPPPQGLVPCIAGNTTIQRIKELDDEGPACGKYQTFDGTPSLSDWYHLVRRPDAAPDSITQVSYLFRYKAKEARTCEDTIQSDPRIENGTPTRREMQECRNRANQALMDAVLNASAGLPEGQSIFDEFVFRRGGRFRENSIRLAETAEDIGRSSSLGRLEYAWDPSAMATPSVRAFDVSSNGEPAHPIIDLTWALRTRGPNDANPICEVPSELAIRTAVLRYLGRIDQVNENINQFIRFQMQKVDSNGAQVTDSSDAKPYELRVLNSQVIGGGSKVPVR